MEQRRQSALAALILTAKGVPLYIMEKKWNA
jgi:hypothetical protein